MAIAIDSRVTFLKKLHLFHGLPEETIRSIAEKMTEVSYPEEEKVFSEGSRADSFFIVYSGAVRVERTRRNKKILLAKLVSGDYFGEEAIFSHRRRSADVIAEKGTTLLALDAKTFGTILRKNRALHSNIEVVVSSRKLARKMRFKWLGKDEVVYLIVRKHHLMLIQTMILPSLLLLFFSLFFLVLKALMVAGNAQGQAGNPSSWIQSRLFLWFTIAGMVASVLWGIWRAIDWGNDYYIVTNRRVIWLEKVIGVYDSRQEAPLSTILSVGVDTDQMGRLMDYGDVIVRTYTGKIPLRHIRHPTQAASMVEEYWLRTKTRIQKNEEIAMKNEIRKRLGLKPLPMEKVDDLESGGTESEPAAPPGKRGLLRMWFSRLFKLRFEQSETITYRKHWYVLWQQVLLPTLFILALIILMIMNARSNSSIKGGVTATLLVALLPFLGWWVYQYVDWRNDIYQVTADQILDIDKKPLGKEERKTAPLENILSTEYERVGLMGILFNFGTVYIRIGSVEFTFQDVYDPPQVQQDIIRRMTARILQKKESALKEERERMAEWLATYHRSAAEFYEEQGNEENAPPNME